MNRLTTDTPVLEMGMYELAHNSCFAQDGEAYYRDFDREISARNFARELAKHFGYEYSEDDEDFDYEIMDDLPVDTVFEVRELIALFYRGLWAQADLYERLKKYEKIGTLEELQELVELRKEKCPQKVLGAFGGTEYECRNCGNEVPYLEDYCEWCGQKQDWSV